MFSTRTRVKCLHLAVRKHSCRHTYLTLLQSIYKEDMATSAGYRRPNCDVLNLSYEKKDDSYLTVLINSVRFHIIAEGRRLQAESGPGVKLAQQYRDLLTAVKAEENDFTKPCSLGNLRTRKGSKGSDSPDSGYGSKNGESPTSSDNDNAADVKGQKEQASSVMQQADSDPSGALSDLLLKPFGSIFSENAPSSSKRKDQNLEEWYSGEILFYSVFIDKDGSLATTEEKPTPELEQRIAGFMPRMYVPKWIRQLGIPWYPARDVTVLRESDEIPPFHPSQVRIGKETYFLKMIDPTQPQPSRREIDYLKRIEKAGLHKQFRVPLIKGLIGFESSKTEIMGVVMTEIEEPTPLTHLLDDEVPQEKRDAWAEESKRIVGILHEHQMVWGDAKADNFMVDKHDNLWIIDFGGSYTDGWIDPELMETEAGDNMAVERVTNALHNPTENTFDPNQSTLAAKNAEADTGNERKVGKLDEDSVSKRKSMDDDSPPRKRARFEESTRSDNQKDKKDAEKEEDEAVGASEVEEDQQDVEEAEEDNDDDERFCFCEKPSSGDMIACDNDSCPRQWFHFDCVGLKQAPKSKNWFCDDCKDD